MRTSLALAALLILPAGAGAEEDSWTGTDKALHLGVSAALASAGYGIASLELDRPGRFLVGGGVGLGAGVAKELLDLSGHGDASWKDLAVDAVGVALGLAISFAVDALISSAAAHPAG